MVAGLAVARRMYQERVLQTRVVYIGVQPTSAENVEMRGLDAPQGEVRHTPACASAGANSGGTENSHSDRCASLHRIQANRVLAKVVRSCTRRIA